MPGETLERWATRLPRGLTAAAARPERELHQRFGPRVLRALQEASPRRTGDLASSWVRRSSGNSETVVSTDPAAAQLEHGGTLEGRPWLAVPIAVDARLLAGPRSDSARLFAFESRDGRLFLATRSTAGLRIRWRLMRSVTQRARPFAGPAFRRAAAEVPRETLRGLREELTRGH